MSPIGSWVPRAALFVGLALYFVWFWGSLDPRTGWQSFDIYQYFYPNMLHAARSIADGGRGFFWNSMQMSGQPFFGISSTATLYPPHLLFLVLDPDLALRAVIVINLVIGGVAMYLLCRQLGLAESASIAGAISFELGNAAIDLSTWTPQVTPAYVWMPAVMLFVERILRAPSVGPAIGLGLALTMAWLVGSPQIVLFTCQLVALRYVWEVLARRAVRPFVALAALTLGLALPFLLAAVQLLPGIAVARDSVRGVGLTMADLLGPDPPAWPQFVAEFSGRRASFNPLVFVPAILAMAALIGAHPRRVALFHAAAGVLYFCLALGPATFLFDVYTSMPFGMLFREPLRFMWVASFCMSVLTAYGVDALAGSAAVQRSWLERCALFLAVAACAGALWALSSTGLRPGEWGLLAVVLVAAAVALRWPAHRRWAGIVIIGAIALDLIALPWWPAATMRLRDLPLRRLLPDGAEMYRHAALFDLVRSRMTPQDRALLVTGHPSAAFGPKTGAQFGVPSLLDYEPQPSLRYAQYAVLMRTGREMDRLRDYYYLSNGPIPPGFQRRLVDLAAARFLIADGAVDSIKRVFRPPPRAMAAMGGVRVYINHGALPRARFVPEVEVVADPKVLLRRLARGPQNPRQIALIEESLASGSRGTPGASGEVEFLRDDPEHLVLRVRATAPGFVHLADQYADGWSARIGGMPVPIARADYVFRLIEVPAGESTVELVYAPSTVRIGAVVSALTAAALIAFAVRSRRRRS